MTASEIKFVVLVAFMILLAVGIIFDPFDTVSYSSRSGSALVIGPLSFGYGIVGLVRGRFYEMTDSKRDGIRWKFWFCAVTFITMGLGSTLLGLDAFGAFGS
jgi:hypothetical protein